jgi:hypothetical protein
LFNLSNGPLNHIRCRVEEGKEKSWKRKKILEKLVLERESRS